MKTKRILSALLGLALLAGGCANEDMLPGGVSSNSPGVHVRLTGVASPSKTRATVAAEAGERTVNSVLAVLFDTHEGFYKTVQATQVGDTDEYTFIVEKDATYTVYLVANASADLRTALESIPAGTPLEDSVTDQNCLETIVADQAPDAAGDFLMVSKYPEKVTTRITETQSIGEVHMIRLAARFDLLNKAEGVTVDKITFENRAVRSSVLTSNTMSTQSDWYETKEYAPNLQGEPEKGNVWTQQIYTYENHAVKGDFMLPKLTIDYTENGQQKKHEIDLIDPSQTTGTTMAIKRNHLYRIILSKASKLDFALEVVDWESEENAQYADIPLVLPKNVQDSLNRQLLVYDLFTEYNVKSLADGKVAFFDHHTTDMAELNPDQYFNETKLKNAGLLAQYPGGTVKDDEGNSYRLPTFGELQLLAPLDENRIQMLSPGIYKYPQYYLTAADQLFKDEFEENVYLKNDEDGNIVKNLVSEIPSEYGFKGMSQLAMSPRVREYVYTKYDTIRPTAMAGAVTFDLVPCYGVRFKGTNQHSAYRWESIAIGDNPLERCISIKIKALPKEADVILADIVDNITFWADGYLEIIIPLSGFYKSNMIQCTNIEGSIVSSSRYYNSKLTRLWNRLRHTTLYPSYDYFQLRLVKVKE